MARCSIAGFVLLAASVAWGQDRPLRGNRGGPPDPVVAVLDVNQDGIVSADELANAPARIAKLDSDGDGDVSRTELREAIRGLLASRPAPGERSPGGRRRSGPGASGGATALQRSGLKLGQPVPDVVVYDEKGNKTRLADFRGQHTVIVFGCLT